MALIFNFSELKIGIFDSGLGGHFVDLQIKKYFPQIQTISLSDQKNIPYGDKTPGEMLTCIQPFMERFVDEAVDGIVMACNTCYLNLADDLRQMTDIPILGYEPDILRAQNETATKSVVVCATPAALKSQRWLELKAQTEAAGLKITELDCRLWVPLIENSKMTVQHLRDVLENVYAVAADSLVLGCTHYLWLQRHLQALLPADYKLSFYEPTAQILRQLEELLLVKSALK